MRRTDTGTLRLSAVAMVFSFLVHTQPALADNAHAKLQKDVIEAHYGFPSIEDKSLCDVTGINHTTPGIEAMRSLAEKGNSVAECILGREYLSSRDVRPDYKEALKWFRKAADQGNPVAEDELGWIYETAIGVSRNYVEAFRWRHKAAEDGMEGDQGILALTYLIGKSTPPEKYKRMTVYSEAKLFSPYVTQDIAEAVKWFRRSANQGGFDGPGFFAESYREGTNGLSKDPVQAYMWKIIDIRVTRGRWAVDPGPKYYEDEKKYIAEYEQGMTSEQIAEAKRRAAQWKQHNEIDDELDASTIPGKKARGQPLTPSNP